ncbi:MAG: HAMP domain-containing sensor histidine kinase [Planctomycetota bacterium]
MKADRLFAAAAIVAGLAAAVAWGVALAGKPADPAARVAEAKAALTAALEAERAAGADVAKRAAQAVQQGGEPVEVFSRLAAIDRRSWSVVFVKEGRVEVWAGVPPAGIEGWALDGEKGVWENSAWWYLWCQVEAAGGRIVTTRTLRPRVTLPKLLMRNAFPADEIALRSGVTIAWEGTGAAVAVGEGISPFLEAPAEPQRRADAARGISGAAAVLLILAATLFFLRSTSHPVLRHGALAAAIWGARFVLLALDVPGALFEGPAFDTSQYGTLRFFHLARTAGDLALTSVFGAIHIAFISARGLPGLPKWLATALPAVFAGVAWIYREHLASIVRDSRVDLLDPESVVPAGASAALWISIAAGSIACFLGARLAARAAGEAFEGWAGESRGKWAKAAAVALTAAMALAGFHDAPALVFLPWLLLLLLRRPAIPIVAVGGALAAAYLSGAALTSDAEAKSRSDLAGLSEKVAGGVDASFRYLARRAASRLVELPSNRPPTERELLDIWADSEASSARGFALGVASYDGHDWRSFSVGLPGWIPSEAEDKAGDLQPRSSSGTLLFDYTVVIAPDKDRPRRVLATVRGPVDENLPGAPLLLVSAPVPRGILAVLEEGVWTDPRLSAVLPQVPAGEPRWQNIDLSGVPYEALFRVTEGDGSARRVWAFGRPRATFVETVIRALRTVFLFALCGAPFGVLLLLSARAARTLSPDLSGRLEVRLTLALLTVSILPVGGLGYLAQSLGNLPLEQAGEKREEEAATIAMKRAAEASGGQYSAVSDAILTDVEDLVGRDVYYYYNGKLKAVGQPSLRTLEVAPGYTPANTWIEIALQGGRFRHGRPGAGVMPAGTTWTAAERSRKAIIGVAADPETGAGDAGRATTLALGGATLIALLLWPLSAFIARRISGPVAALTAAAGKIESGDLTVRVRVRAEGEVADLVAAFNRMTEGLVRGREALAREERERAWREMARQVAHEIKNPLTPLKLSLQNLRAAWEAQDADFAKQLEESVDMTIGQIDLLARIATNFSQFAGKPSRAIVELDLNEILRDVVGLFKPTAPKVTFVEDLESPLAPVRGDRDEVARAFTNLVKNALQAMPGGGMLTVTSRAEGLKVHLRIRDTGVGIPEDMKGRMFEPYFSTKTEGTGLGLGIVRRVIEDMNGRITFESVEGKGTTMILVFPAAGTRLGPVEAGGY